VPSTIIMFTPGFMNLVSQFKVDALTNQSPNDSIITNIYFDLSLRFIN